jgi:hypothetical protein
MEIELNLSEYPTKEEILTKSNSVFIPEKELPLTDLGKEVIFSSDAFRGYVQNVTDFTDKQIYAALDLYYAKLKTKQKIQLRANIGLAPETTDEAYYAALLKKSRTL